jgi:DMSO reductase family type II enzyme heme b subunit
MYNSRIFLCKVYQARPRVFKVAVLLDCFLKALFLSALLCLGSLAVALPQNPESELPKKFSSELLKARYDKTAQFKLQAGSWDKAVATQFKMFAQTTVPLNDKIANAMINKTEAKEFLARAIYNDTSLLIKLEWADSSQSLFSRKETNSYGDSVAIEIPKEFSARLPYVGMGDEQKNVYVYMQRAAEEGILASEYIAAGFGSLTRLYKTISKMQMNYDTKTNKWQAIFSLPLALRNMRQFVVPVAFAFWDGAKNQRGGNKYLSAWQFIELATFKKNRTHRHGFFHAV